METRVLTLMNRDKAGDRSMYFKIKKRVETGVLTSKYSDNGGDRNTQIEIQR